MDKRTAIDKGTSNSVIDFTGKYEVAQKWGHMRKRVLFSEKMSKVAIAIWTIN